MLGRLHRLALAIARTIRLPLALQDAKVLSERFQLTFGNLLLLFHVLKQFEDEIHILLGVLQRFDHLLRFVDRLLDGINGSTLVHWQRRALLARRLRLLGSLVTRSTIVTSRKIAAIPPTVVTAIPATVIAALIGPGTTLLIGRRTVFRARLAGGSGGHGVWRTFRGRRWGGHGTGFCGGDCFGRNGRTVGSGFLRFVHGNLFGFVRHPFSADRGFRGFGGGVRA